MGRMFRCWTGILLLVLATGCNKAARDDQGIRAAVQKHLSANSSLNMAAMEMNIRQVAIEGDRAQAQVEFRLRQGEGAMQMTYSLERQGGAWTVVHGQPAGGEISHPPLDQPPPGSTANVPSRFQWLNEPAKSSGTAPSASVPASPPPASAASKAPDKRAPATPQKAH